ncbi:MAG: DUF5777 family beta-barrel protein [Thermoanaerobaculia bacterium]|jgi:hypothetical protein
MIDARAGDRPSFTLALPLLLLFAALPLWGEEAVQLPPFALGGTLLNVPTAATLPAKTSEVRFTHRFSQPVNEGDADSLWGLDGSSDIGIAYSYGVTSDLEGGIYRSDVQDDWELSAKYALRRQSGDYPLSITVRAGADVRTEDGSDDGATPFAQCVLEKQIGPRLKLIAAPSVIGEWGAYDYAFNVPLGLAWSIKPHMILAVEVIPENGDQPDGFDSSVGWSVGLKHSIGGHFFEFVVGNTRATHVSQYVTSSIFASTEPAAMNGFEAGDVFLGFNIERRFGGM